MVPRDAGNDRFNSSDYQALYEFLLRHVPAQEVRDVVQEAFKRYLEINPKASIRNPLAYVHGIAWKVVCDFRTRQKRKVVSFNSDEIEKILDRRAGPRADPVWDQLSSMEELKRLLNRLSPKKRQVLILHQLDGYTEAEIAEQMGLSIHTVKKYSTQALSHLRKAVAGSEPT